MAALMRTTDNGSGMPARSPTAIGLCLIAPIGARAIIRLVGAVVAGGDKRLGEAVTLQSL